MRLLIGVNKSRDRYYRKTRAAKQEKEENIGGPRTSVCCHWRMLPLAYAATRATDLTQGSGFDIIIVNTYLLHSMGTGLISQYEDCG